MPEYLSPGVYVEEAPGAGPLPGVLGEPGTERRLSWSEVVSSFHVLSASGVLAMERLERHQDVRGRVRWLTGRRRPLALLFVSHRWETLDHPDPTGAQLRGVQTFLRHLCACLEAAMLPRGDRLRVVPSIAREGVLQAEELARRILGFGPFGDARTTITGRDARARISSALRRMDGTAFRSWLLENVGVWLDYPCMPQKPLAGDDLVEFRSALSGLDALVQSAHVIALRRTGDDYPERGWCASEFFLASGRSFARGIAIDIGRMADSGAVEVPPQPSVVRGPGAEAMRAAYDLDLSAWHEACEAWVRPDGPLASSSLPDAWSAYRSLQGSAFRPVESDPNPFRRAMEVVSGLETRLVAGWLMSAKPRQFDVGEALATAVRQAGLRCSEAPDLVYLGLVLACHGWVETFRPLFRAALRSYVGGLGGGAAREASIPFLPVRVLPLRDDVRALLARVAPSSPGTWRYRLATRGGGGDPREEAVVAELLAALAAAPPAFELLEARDGARENLEDLGG